MNKEYEKLGKEALGCMYAATLIATVVVMGIVTGVCVYFGFFKYDIVLYIYIGLIVFAVLDLIISPSFRFHRYRYRLDEDAVEIIEGYIFVSHSIVPIERIQNIELSQGPVDRIFKVAKVTVTTGGSDVTLRFVSMENAEKIAELLKKKINSIVVENRKIDDAGEVTNE